MGNVPNANLAMAHQVGLHALNAATGKAWRERLEALFAGEYGDQHSLLFTFGTELAAAILLEQDAVAQKTYYARMDNDVSVYDLRNEIAGIQALRKEAGEEILFDMKDVEQGLIQNMLNLFYTFFVGPSTTDQTVTVEFQMMYPQVDWLAQDVQEYLMQRSCFLVNEEFFNSGVRMFFKGMQVYPAKYAYIFGEDTAFEIASEMYKEHTSPVKPSEKRGPSYKELTRAWDTLQMEYALVKPGRITALQWTPEMLKEELHPFLVALLNKGYHVKTIQSLGMFMDRFLTRSGLSYLETWAP